MFKISYDFGVRYLLWGKTCDYINQAVIVWAANEFPGSQTGSGKYLHIVLGIYNMISLCCCAGGCLQTLGAEPQGKTSSRPGTS